MTLTQGTRLGTYEIVAPLGEIVASIGVAGIGEVFLALDTKLGPAAEAAPAAVRRRPLSRLASEAARISLR